MKNLSACVVLNVLVLASGLLGCREDDSGPAPAPARSTGGAGGAATGGRGGRGAGAGGSGGTGTTAGTGGSSAAGSGAAGAGAAGSGGGPAGTSGSADAAADASGSDLAGDGNPAASDGAIGMPGPDGGIAICWPDPAVIMICRQLENACENCPPGGAPPGNKLAQVCFDLIKKAKAGMATDAECAKFAVDNKCTVDKGGNVCGSLNCYAPTCTDRARCLNRQQWGDSGMCRPFVASCGPCM
jgi:hypothetical protein